MEKGDGVGDGRALQVKVVGCLALIDDGETDWKLVSGRECGRRREWARR